MLGAGQARTPGVPPSGKRAAPPTTTKPAPKSQAPAAATPQRQQSLQREQRELQSELAKLKRQLAASEASRSEASDALASSDIAISRANRRLRELSTARNRVEQQIAALAQREQDVAVRQGERQSQLDQLLRRQQRLSLRDPLHLLLEGESPGDLGREQVYLDYLTRTTDASVSQLQSRRAELAVLQERSQEKKEELAKIAEEEDKNRLTLEQEQARRKRTLEQLSKQIIGQRQSIARLERDEQRLGTLIDRISKVLAEQSRREAERTRHLAEREAKAKVAARGATAPKDPKPERAAARTPSDLPPSSSNFGQQKGKLRLPVDGAVSARFGAPRRGDGGSTGPSWKGVFLQAPAGVDVKAVGDGQVVFADWLRGFGNLLVIDHGEGYLSIYGNNEALLRNVGDRVAVGEVVASVGNTGGNEAPGLYFELRFQGRPFDPLTWVAAR
ncbi:MAG TPA: peptidoglycan DD-metalloendopeptidase family protein [Burkholderiaceae bacterium]|nr:peptidoglycan DD-metalloendopeptidase family protein [Burkholderiaceae bacterium]